MYKISVPVMNTAVTADSRPVYAELLRKARVDRIFLCVTDYSYETGDLCNCIPSLRENVAYFQEQGFETALWVAETIGHGMALSGVKALSSDQNSLFAPLVDLEGNVRHGTHCPSDSAFRRLAASFVAELATTGASAIMLDDDFRMSAHGPNPCCACEAHLQEISRICGEPVTRENLKQAVMAGKPNRYRDAWLQAQGESLKSLAREIREAVDVKAPHVPVIVCSAPCHWDLDGVDTLELNRIFGRPPRSRGTVVRLALLAGLGQCGERSQAVVRRIGYCPYAGRSLPRLRCYGHGRGRRVSSSSI
ncbi:MAG: hypothetical protein IJY42_05030 [Clostridia bacterium]|nr:hypothetical protein [Clostridia bacterium]